MLTDDNPPAISDVRSDAGYLSCLLNIAKPEHVGVNQKDSRLVILSVLAVGAIVQNLIVEMISQLCTRDPSQHLPASSSNCFVAGGP